MDQFKDKGFYHKIKITHDQTNLKVNLELTKIKIYCFRSYPLVRFRIKLHDS